MEIILLRLIFDFGLVVLIWLVQLIIYPGFQYFSPPNLQKWHKIYTTRIAIVVLPLMLGQLGVAASQLWRELNLYTAGSMLLIMGTWLMTFFIFIPLHSGIAKGAAAKVKLRALVNKNWIRTILWTFIFIWSLYFYFKRSLNVFSSY